MRFLTKRNKSNLWGDLDSEIACYFSSIFYFSFCVGGCEGIARKAEGEKKNSTGSRMGNQDKDIYVQL
jgi:hypothetical protein